MHITFPTSSPCKVVGKVFCKILNDRLVQYLDKSSKIHEGQAGFRAGRCCIDNIFTLNELIQGHLKEGKKTFSFFPIFKKEGGGGEEEGGGGGEEGGVGE